MSTSDPRHVKAARKRYPCDWCYETIEKGKPYVRWFTYGENVMARLHPECYRAQVTWSAATQDVELPIAGTYRRGCHCEDNPCECETRQAPDGAEGD